MGFAKPLVIVFYQLQFQNTYSDVTLACDGKFFPAHKLVLSTCSDYFNEMLQWTQCRYNFLMHYYEWICYKFEFILWNKLLLLKLKCFLGTNLIHKIKGLIVFVPSYSLKMFIQNFLNDLNIYQFFPYQWIKDFSTYITKNYFFY